MKEMAAALWSLLESFNPADCTYLHVAIFAKASSLTLCNNGIDFTSDLYGPLGCACIDRQRQRASCDVLLQAIQDLFSVP